MAQIGIDGGAIRDAIEFFTNNTPEDKRKRELAALEERRARFFDVDLPELANEFYENKPDDLAAHQLTVIKAMQRAQRAGLSDAQFGNVLQQLLPVARARSAKSAYADIDARRKQRGDQIAEQDITNEPAGDAQQNAAALREAFRDQSNFNQDDALKLGELEATTGVKIPQHLAENLRVPSQVRADESQARLRLRQASREHTNQKIDEQQLKQLEKMEGEAGQVARATRGRGLPPYLDAERDRAQREPLTQAQTAKERADIGRINSMADLNRARTGNVRAGGESLTETTTERAVNPLDQSAAERVIADTARARGTTDAESLRQIAADYGYDLAGDAKVSVLKKPGRIYGENDVVDKSGQPIVKLTGKFRLRPKATKKTTRKGQEQAPTSSREELLRRYGLD